MRTLHQIRAEDVTPGMVVGYWAPLTRIGLSTSRVTRVSFDGANYSIHVADKTVFIHPPQATVLVVGEQGTPLVVEK